MPNELIKTLTVDGTTYDLPTKTSELSNDSGFITSESDPVFTASAAHGISSSDISNWNAKVDSADLAVVATSGSYTDLSDKPTIPTVPTKLSGFTDDLGSSPVHTHSQYLTSYTETDPVFTASAAHGITSTDITNWNNKSDFSGDYDDLTDKPEIDDVYWCTYGTTTSAQIETALTAGKIPIVRYQDYVYTLRFRNSSTNHRFVCNYGGKEKSVVCQSGTWMPNADLTFLTSYTETDPVFTASASAGITSADISNWDSKGTYSKPSGGIPKSDLASAVQTSLGKADTALQSYTETDPVFTASVAHGISSTDISNWNNKSDFSGSYNDLADKPTIPTVPINLSSFTDDLGSSPTHTHSQYLPLSGGTMTGGD